MKKLLGVLLLCFALVGQAATLSLNLVIESTVCTNSDLLIKIKPEYRPQMFDAKLNGEHVCWIIDPESGTIIVVDGKSPILTSTPSNFK